MNYHPKYSTPAKIALYFLLLGGAMLLGGIPFQIILGVSRLGAQDEVEKVIYQLMSQGSMVLVVAYAIVFCSGLAFWRLGPYRLRGQRWFLVAFLAFYIWAPLDWYLIGCDLRFALGFAPSLSLSAELKNLFDVRQSLGPLPLLTLAGYLIAIGMVIFKPRLGQRGNPV